MNKTYIVHLYDVFYDYPNEYIPFNTLEEAKAFKKQNADDGIAIDIYEADVRRIA